MRFEQEWKLRQVGTEDWFPAHVPGNIQYDYAVSHDFGDIWFGMVHEKFLAIEDYEWEYRTELKFERKPGERVFFVTHGVDYFFDVALNGKVLCEHEGMFTDVELDLTDRLAEGANALSVFVHRHPKLPGAAVNRDQAAGSCKPAVSYTWDYHPRVLPSGMWEDAYVETRPAGFIRSAECTYELNDDLTRADVTFLVDCDQPCRITLCGADGSVIREGTETSFAVDTPKLWWCNGQGEPYLYSWRVESADDVRCGTVGFRRVELVMNEGETSERDGFPKSRLPAPMTIRLNGRRIFAKGSNWVLPDMFPGNLTDERLREYVRLAHDANMNILRCHGGSGICRDEFYAECDRLGVMIWVEFPLACNNYVSTPHYLKVLEQEATAIIRKLRPHVSVTIWCGGNELFNSWSRMTDQSLALRLLNKLTLELSPERPFLMTSPLNGVGHGGYTFWDDAKKCDCFGVFQNSHCTGYCEFGVPGTPGADYLRRILPEEVLFPPVFGEKNWTAHNAFRQWGEQRWLCLDVIARYWDVKDLDELVFCSQWLQCEGYKAIFEEARRQWPNCSFAMNWCLTEPWTTAANNSLISYPCIPKPALAAVKDSLRSVAFSARVPKFDWNAGELFTAELWLLNDSPAAAAGEVEAELEIDGRVYPLGQWKAEAAAGRNAKGPALSFRLPVSKDGVLLLRLKAGEASSEYRLWQNRADKAVPVRR